MNKAHIYTKRTRERSNVAGADDDDDNNNKNHKNITDMKTACAHIAHQDFNLQPARNDRFEFYFHFFFE